MSENLLGINIPPKQGLSHVEAHEEGLARELIDQQFIAMTGKPFDMRPAAFMLRAKRRASADISILAVRLVGAPSPPPLRATGATVVSRFIFGVAFLGADRSGKTSANSARICLSISLKYAALPLSSARPSAL